MYTVRVFKLFCNNLIKADRESAFKEDRSNVENSTWH